MKAVIDVITDEDYEEYRTVLAKCTGTISATADLVQMATNGTHSYPLANRVIVEGNALSLTKGEYFYITVQATTEEAEKFASLFQASLRQEGTAAIFSVIAQEPAEDMLYQLMVVQPIVVYRDGSSIQLVCNRDELLYNSEQVHFETVAQEVESELNYQLEMEDEEDLLQQTAMEAEADWLSQLTRR